jgi:hypothetical protein
MDVSYGAYECRIKCAGRQKKLKSSDAKSKETLVDTFKVSVMTELHLFNVSGNSFGIYILDTGWKKTEKLIKPIKLEK